MLLAGSLLIYDALGGAFQRFRVRPDPACPLCGERPSITGGSVARSLEPTNTNGNNVNLDMETVTATETGLRYQLALNALDGKYNVLRTALRTQ